MSHYTKVKINVTDRRYVEAALDRMGLKYTEGGTIKAAGVTEDVDLKLANKFGLREQQDLSWASVGDTWHADVPAIANYYGRTPTFENDLTTNYAIEEAVDVFGDQGYQLAENEEAVVGEDGLITMVFENYE